MIFVLGLILCCVSGLRAGSVNSLVPRLICFSQDQPNCNQSFLDAYPELSRSADNITKADTFFLLFTRKNKDKPELLHKCGGKLPPDTNYDPSKKLVVILDALAFGFCNTGLFRECKDLVLKREDVNVMHVDYGWGNKDPGTAIRNIKVVAKQTVQVFKNIKSQKGLDYKKIHIFSVSLGAQLAGQIGGLYHVGRITGLEPAGPGFAKDKTPLIDRLDPSDADLVDVFHCNMGKCLPNLGIDYDAGHINYYINGGIVQPACYPKAIKMILQGDTVLGLNFLLQPMLCPHAMALEYFRATITPGCCQQVGFKCPSLEKCQLGIRSKTCGKNGKNCQIMGYDLDKVLTKVPKPYKRYYVETDLLCPYCKTNQTQLGDFTKTYQKSLQNQTCN